MEGRPAAAKRRDGLPLSAFLERTLLEMSRNPLIELADNLARDADIRSKEEGDAGPFLEALAEFLQGRQFAIIGGVAVRSYVRDRPTLDFDLMISDAEWPDLVRFLSEHGAESAGSVEDTFLYTFGDFKLDLDIRIARSDLDREALGAVVTRRFKKWILRVVKPDHLAAMKLKAHSERKGTRKGDRDRNDVLDLLAGHASEAALRELLGRHRPDLIAVLEEVLRAGRA